VRDGILDIQGIRHPLIDPDTVVEGDPCGFVDQKPQDRGAAPADVFEVDQFHPGVCDHRFRQASNADEQRLVCLRHLVSPLVNPRERRRVAACGAGGAP
jgi:hypothetical protein